MYRDFLSKICEDFGIDAPEYVAGSVFYMTFNDDYSVGFLLTKPNRFCLMASVMPQALPLSRDHLQHALKLNLAMVHERRECLAIDPSDNHLMLYRGVNDHHIQYKDFKNMIEEFIVSLAFWRTKMQSMISTKKEGSLAV
ncbi:MAG: type III secretion system chaperone [Alphaproteobacteria bacterium]|jgi:hypothetical protein|nr:type III secretion system chaperone [Alphaproteobacteria bacterium]MBP9878048.1 type III secretion system chaperone [Alphaproteobacteria bacterium]